MRSPAAADTYAGRPATPATSAAEDEAAAVIDASAAAADVVGAPTVTVDPIPAAAPEPASAVEPSCRHACTRTRQKGGRIERYCEKCGVLVGRADDARYAGPVR